MFSSSRYLERIGINSANQSTTLSFLNELIYAHQCTVPFETIDIYDFHRIPSLNLDDLYEKLVVKRRGGYCFELNALFTKLLQELGYDAWPCLYCINPEGVPGAINHRGIIVKLDGEHYMVDVGMGGPMPAFALAFDGGRQTGHGETYWIEKTDTDWLLFRRLTGAHSNTGEPRKEATRGTFNPAPVDASAFEEPNVRKSTDPDSSFLQMRQVNLRTPHGHRSVKGNTYVEIVDGVRTETPIAQNDLPRVLRERFGLVIDGALREDT